MLQLLLGELRIAMNNLPLLQVRRLRFQVARLIVALLSSCYIVTASFAGPELKVQSAVLSTTRLAISAAGELIASETDGVVYLREGVGGRILRHWRVAEGTVWGGWICFPRGKEELAVSDGRRISLWDTATGLMKSEWLESGTSGQCIDGVGIFDSKWTGERESLKYSRVWPRDTNAASMVDVPKNGVRQSSIFPVAGDNFVGVAQTTTVKDQPLASISLFDRRSGKVAWTSPDIPTHFRGIDWNRTLAVSPDGMLLAYINQLQGPGNSLSSLHVKGRVVLISPRSGKELLHSAMKNIQGHEVAFVNDGKWLMVAEYDPDRIVFYDIETGKKLRAIDGRPEAVVHGKANALIIRSEAGPFSMIVDLPSLAKRASVGRDTETVEEISAYSGRLLVSSDGRIKEIPVSVPGDGLELKSVASSFVVDETTGRILYMSKIEKVSGKDVSRPSLRLSSGKEVQVLLPPGDVATLAVFVLGKDLIIVSLTVADAVKLAELRDLDVDKVSTGSREATGFEVSVPVRFYSVTNDGRATLIGERKGLPNAMRVQSDGEVLWLAQGSDLVGLHLPTFVEQQRHSLDFAPSDLYVAADGSKVLASSLDQVAAMSNGSWSRYSGNFIYSASPGPDGQVFLTEGNRLKGWVPEKMQHLPSIPSYATVAENASRWFAAHAIGPALIVDVPSGKEFKIRKPCRTDSVISPDGRYFLCRLGDEGKSPQQMSVEEITSGRAVQSFEVASSKAIFSADSQAVLYVQKVREESRPGVYVSPWYAYVARNVISGRMDEVFREKDLFHVSSAATSGDRSLVVVATSSSSWDADAKQFLKEKYLLSAFRRNGEAYSPVWSIVREPGSSVTSLDVSIQGDLVAFGDSGFVTAFDAANGQALWRKETSGNHEIRFSQDGKALAGTSFNGKYVAVFDSRAGTLVRDRRIPPSQLGAQVPKYLLTRTGIIEASDQRASVLHPLSVDPSVIADQVLFSDDAEITKLAQLSPDLLALLRQDGVITLFSLGKKQALARIAMMPSGNWVVVAPDGRFDTGSLEDLAPLHWVLPEEPYRALPLEIFMRDYYEPRLLTRILNGDKFKPVRALSELNRLQSHVKITDVRPDARHPGHVEITVEAAGVRRAAAESGQPATTAVHDLRLFRNGQMVGYAEGKLADAEGKPFSRRFRVRLPAGKAPLHFTAYAFNDDRVKSATAQISYTPPHPVVAGKPRAYIVAVGVNRHDNPAWDLRYAANDARQITDSLAPLLGKQGRYEAVVTVPLISDEQGGKLATKANLKAVFDVLAGRKAKVDGIPGADQLRAATPDDLVLISFSGHGYGEGGQFYLVPGDTGAGSGRQVTPELTTRAISSDELSNWLKDVDAGEMVMIVDACHSAASVGEDFKPGPMGSRGLGQLAFDKGMRILAATQSDDVALESDLIKQGLLSYALVRDGLGDQQADYKPKDRKITLDEWLSYGVDRVPRLAEEVISGKVIAARGTGQERAAVLVSGGESMKKRAFQTPALFDFRRNTRGDELRLQ